MSKGMIVGAVAVLGAVLALVALFVSWVDGSIFGVKIASLTGFEVLTDSEPGKLEYRPLMVLAGAIVAALVGILALSGKGGVFSSVALAVMGIVIIVGAILIFPDLEEYDLLGLPFKESAGIGLYLTIAAGAIVALAPVAGMGSSE